MREDLARRTGEDVTDVNPLDLNLARAAMTRGLLVDVWTRRWRYAPRLTPQDSGIPEGVAMPKGFTPERVALLPDRVLKSLRNAETLIRRAAPENGFPVRGYRGTFVPARDWHRFKEMFERGRRDLTDAVEDICANLEDYRAEVGVHLGQADLVNRAWRGHRGTWTEGDTVAPGALASLAEPTELFRETWVLGFTRHIPPPDVLRASMDVGYHLSILHVPEAVVAVDIARDHAALAEEVARSLEEQRESLPRRFVESVLAAEARRFEKLRTRAANAGGGSAGGVTKLFNAALLGLEEIRRQNLVAEPRVEQLVRDTVRALKVAQARANASDRPVHQGDILAPLQRAAETINKLVEELGDDDVE